MCLLLCGSHQAENVIVDDFYRFIISLHNNNNNDNDSQQQQNSLKKRALQIQSKRHDSTDSGNGIENTTQ